MRHTGDGEATGGEKFYELRLKVIHVDTDYRSLKLLSCSVLIIIQNCKNKYFN